MILENIEVEVNDLVYSTNNTFAKQNPLMIKDNEMLLWTDHKEEVYMGCFRYDDRFYVFRTDFSSKTERKHSISQVKINSINLKNMRSTKNWHLSKKNLIDQLSLCQEYYLRRIVCVCCEFEGAEEHPKIILNHYFHHP